MRSNEDTAASIDQAAAILAARRKSGAPGPRLPESCRPTSLDAALRIQAAVSEQIGEAIGAWKCGLPAEGILVAAPIYAGGIHAASPCAVWTQDRKARVEPELAFVLGHDLPPRDTAYTPAEVDAAIVRTHLALELIGSRCTDAAEASFAENLADGLFNQGLFLGPQVDGELARHTEAMPIRVRPSNAGASELSGRHPNGNPRLALYWLAEFLRGTGQGLRAGQAVITGSYAGCIELPLDEAITVRYGELGELTVCFAGK